MRLRIVAGELGGRVIDVPRHPDLRATADRVREAWFSALGSRLENVHVVDLFAGSGALGMEALSRGASRATFVESDRRLAEALRSNLVELGVAHRSRVVHAEVLGFLRNRSLHWDVALADPPYGKGLAGKLVERFRRRPFADILCVEHELRALPCEPDVWWTRRYGDTELTFVTAETNGSESEAISEHS